MVARGQREAERSARPLEERQAVRALKAREDLFICTVMTKSLPPFQG